MALFLSLAFLSTIAQKPLRWEIGGSLNGVGYLGDLNKNDLISKEFHLGYSSYIRHYVSDYFAIRSSLMMGEISGSDVHYSSRASRNLTMSSPLVELAAVVEWDLNDMNPEYYRYKYKLRGISTPYFFAGVGGVYTNPSVNYSETTSPYTTTLEGIKRDENAIRSKYNVVFPFGFGYKFDLNPCWGLAVEAAFRISTTDYLDGVSYAGNPNKPDAYQVLSFSVMHRLGRYRTFPFKPYRR